MKELVYPATITLKVRFIDVLTEARQIEQETTIIIMLITVVDLGF